MGKLFNIAMFGRLFTQSMLLQRFLPRVASIMLFTIIAAVLGGVLLTGAFYALYTILSHHMDPDGAALVVTGLIFLTVIVLIGLAVLQLRKLRTLSFTLPAQDMPALSHMGNIVDAFMNGLMTPRPRPRLRNY